MQKLNFPAVSFQLKNSENKTRVFDVIRKKYIVLSPEEWVRQHLVHYLFKEKGYPKSHINVERQFTVNGLRKRFDIVVFNRDGSIAILAECKAPTVAISQAAFDQAARYNSPLNARYFIVTNGLDHYVCEVDYQKEKYRFLAHIPEFSH